MAEGAQTITPITSPRRVFKGHRNEINSAAVFSDGRRMVTASDDKTLRLWDLMDGGMLKEMVGHRERVRAVAVSRDGKLIASGGENGELIAWDGDTGARIIQFIKGHSSWISSLDFSPDNTVLATVSGNGMINLWRTDTWDIQENPIQASTCIHCVRFSHSGKHFAVGTDKYIQIWNASGSECIAKFRPERVRDWAWNTSLAWTPDGTRLFSAGSKSDPTIREWDTSTWKQVRHPWTGHTNDISTLAINSTGTLIASASYDGTVRLWQLSDQRTIAIFLHSNPVFCGTFSIDGKHIFSGGCNDRVSEWAVPEHPVIEDTPDEPAPDSTSQDDVPEELQMDVLLHPNSIFVSMIPSVRNAYLTRDLSTAERLLTQQVDIDGNNYSAYANRSFIHAQRCDWDHALRDACKSLDIQHSLTGYIAKGIALCGKLEFKEAMEAFDLSFMFMTQDSNTTLLLMIKAIALFNAHQHDEAIRRIQALAPLCCDVNTYTCRIVGAYLLVQLGLIALNDARYIDAADHFTTAINSNALSYHELVHPKYDIFVVLFGWDLASVWTTAHQNQCEALLRAGQLVEAHDAYKYMMDVCNDTTKTSCLDWSTDFTKECSALYAARGSTAAILHAYGEAIDLYSAAIDLYPTTDATFACRCRARLEMTLWEEALDDANKVIELNSSSYIGHHLKHAALYGAARYDEAIEALQLSIYKLNYAPDSEAKTFRTEYITLYAASGDAALAARAYERAIQLYSVVIDLDPANDAVIANRCQAKLGKMLWDDALVDAQKVINLNPSYFLGYHLKHAALHGAQRYDDAIDALQMNLSKLNDAHGSEAQQFKTEYSILYAASGDAALVADAYNTAIQLYSVAIDLDPVADILLANRCRAKLEILLWEGALVDAEKVIKLNPLSYVGYELKHAALHGAERYDEAIETLQLVRVTLANTYVPEMQSAPQYISPPDAHYIIRNTIDAHMNKSPPRLFNTFSGRLCDQNAQINLFEESTEYKELLSLTMRYGNLQSERIKSVVCAFFQYAMLSHRWETDEPLLPDIQGKQVYTLDSGDGIRKLQSFCKVARDRGYRWAWSDTCCIDKSTIIELQQSINSMFLWYHLSALTIIYLSDVLPRSKPGALAGSRWVTRGWTVQEFLAPRVVLFYQQDWTLYFDDQSLNHKESAVIMQELAHATGINPQALIAFRPEMRGAREKLQWSSMRVTKFEEDIAYSLCGILGVFLSPIYGERKQNALGRLLQEVIARSGDITCLDWVGESSEFNSCLPSDITSYAAPPFTVPSLPDYEMETSASALADARITELAYGLYTTLECMHTPRFMHQRLHLPCIVFSVIQVAPKRRQEQDSCLTYTVKAKGLCDLLITTADQLPSFSRIRPIRQKFLLVHPWDRNLLELNHFSKLSNSVGDMQSITTVGEDTQTIRSSMLEADPESQLRALRLLVRLGQPFAAFLLAEQWGGEYKRVATDYYITAQVKQITSVRDLMDVRTLEIS